MALIVALVLSATPAQASRTGSWGINPFDGSSNSAGNVTTVSVQIETYESGPWWNPQVASYFSLDAGALSQPFSGVYTPNVNGVPSLEVTYDPGDTSTTTEITFTFSNPVSDPVLHVDRLGGQSGGTNSSAWTLDTAASDGAVSLARLSGVDHFVVDNGGTRFRGSANQNANNNWDSECRNSAASGAACGSVRINGTFTTLVFDVQMLGSAGSGDAVELAFTFDQDLGDASSDHGRALHAMPETVDRYLGNAPPDDDADGNEYSAGADHDDNTASDDEDGVMLPSFSPGQSATVTVAVHEPSAGSSYLQAWVDWNRDGDFADSGERIANNVTDNGSADQDSTSGTIALDVNAPATAATGQTVARFRWSSQSGLAASGDAAVDGEVEDHPLQVVNLVTCPTGSSGTGGGVASGGNGAYRDAIYWLDWNCGSRPHFEAGSAVEKRWQFGPVEIRATLHNITAPLNIYNTGSWSGDLLDDLYSGVNPVGLANPSGQESSFVVDWEVYLNGNAIPANIITADAEDTDDGEFLHWHTNGGPWQIFAVAPNSDLQVRFSNAGRDLRLSSLPGAGEGSLLAMSEGVTATSHTIHGSGVEALAFGVFVSVDYGDLPSGYPEGAGHLFHHLISGGDQPASDTDANTLELATVAARPPYLGVLAPDAEANIQHSPDASTDGPEDDGVTFPALLPGSIVSLTVQVAESAPGSGYLQGWVDWNRDGDFLDAGERVADNVQDNGSQDADAAVGAISLAVFVPPGAMPGTAFARFRFSDTANAAAGNQLVNSGEIEDYAIAILPAGADSGLAGRVFNDNGSAGGVAHNGVRDGGEPGLAGVPVRLLHDSDGDGICDGSEPVLAEDITDGNGDWWMASAAGDVGKTACLVAGTPAGYRPVSEDDGGHALVTGGMGDNAQALTVPGAAVFWGGIGFGLVPQPVLQADRQGSVAPGGGVLYSHRFVAGSAGSVDFGVQGAVSSPAAPVWTRTVYRDGNCDGRVNGGDAQLATQTVAVTAGDTLCLVVRVFAPSDAPLGALDRAPLVAHQVLAGTVLVDEVSVVDQTRVIAGQLVLEKTVRNIGPDGQLGTADDVDAAFQQHNDASPGDVLRYRLRFFNPGSNPLAEIDVHDVTPAFTHLNAVAICPAVLPAGIVNCVVITADGTNGAGYRGSIHWSLDGALPSGASGTVQYDVRVAP